MQAQTCPVGTCGLSLRRWHTSTLWLFTQQILVRNLAELYFADCQLLIVLLTPFAHWSQLCFPKKSIQSTNFQFFVSAKPPLSLKNVTLTPASPQAWSGCDRSRVRKWRWVPAAARPRFGKPGGTGSPRTEAGVQAKADAG